MQKRQERPTKKISLQEIITTAARQCYSYWGYLRIPVSAAELRIKVSNALIGYGIDNNTIDRCINWSGDPSWKHPEGVPPLAHALNPQKRRDRGFYIPNPELFEGEEKEHLLEFYDTDYPTQVGKLTSKLEEFSG